MRPGDPNKFPKFPSQAEATLKWRAFSPDIWKVQNISTETRVDSACQKFMNTILLHNGLGCIDIAKTMIMYNGIFMQGEIIFILELLKYFTLPFNNAICIVDFGNPFEIECICMWNW